jgi:hypothetical protein
VGIGKPGRPTDTGRSGQAGAGLNEMPMGGSGIKFQAHSIRPGRMGLTL